LPWNNLLLSVSGLLFGWVLIPWIEAWFVREWLLLILPALAIFCNELQLTKIDISMLVVYALITGLHELRETGQDFFERLIKVGWPASGEIQAAVGIFQRRRSGFLIVMPGVKRFHQSDELVFVAI
jgi:hypothetical protein